MKEIIWYLLRIPVKLYYLTWVFTLVLFKREIPKWLVGRVETELREVIVLGNAKPYKR
jgi:hypothetical protein